MKKQTDSNHPEDDSREKCAEGVARALLRDVLDHTAATAQKIDALEMQLRALATKRGITLEQLAAMDI